MSNYSWHVDNSRAKQFKHNPMNTFDHLEQQYCHYERWTLYLFSTKNAP